jgi:hypothetical protein
MRLCNVLSTGTLFMIVLDVIRASTAGVLLNHLLPLLGASAAFVLVCLRGWRIEKFYIDATVNAWIFRFGETRIRPLAEHWRPQMSETLKELRDLPDKELIRRHDDLAGKTVVGTQHYLAELARRDGDRSLKVMARLTWVIVAMTAVVTIATLANVVILLLQRQ